MRVAILGPLCRDTVIIDGQAHGQLGGVTYYAGMALASLGAEVTLIASFGDESDTFLAPLKNLYIARVPATETIHFTNVYNSKNPDHRQQSARIPQNIIDIENLKPVDLTLFDAIILGPLFHNNFTTEALAYIAQTNIPTYLAGQGLIRYLENDSIVWQHPEKFLQILPFVTNILLDEAELAFITGQNDPHRGIEILQQHGAKQIIVTAGSRGSRIFNNDQSCQIPAFPPDRIVDPTGAGDSYLAGFVYAQLFGKDIKSSGMFAAMTATMAISTTGPCTATASEIDRALTLTHS